MVGKIADCCDDGKLRRLVEGTPAFAELVDEDVSYQGKDGRKRWNELGDTIADVWERAVKRVEDWLNWQGDFSDSRVRRRRRVGLVAHRRRADRAALRRRHLPDRARRGAGRHRGRRHRGRLPGQRRLGRGVHRGRRPGPVLPQREGAPPVKLEWWSELADVEDDAVFTPDDADSTTCASRPAAGAELVRELAVFCGLEADTDVLDGPASTRTTGPTSRRGAHQPARGQLTGRNTARPGRVVAPMTLPTKLDPLPLSVLDVAPVGEGVSTSDALRSTIALAARADELGFSRFWVAEHHSMAGIASSAPAVLIGCDRRGHRADPGRLGRRDAAQPRPAGDRRAVRHPGRAATPAGSTSGWAAPRAATR